MGSLQAALPVIGLALLIIAVLTAALMALRQVIEVETVTIIYLISVLFAAIRGGVLPAVVAAVAAMACAAFFFYEPIYDLRVNNPIHLIDMALFIVVAVVTGKLATDARKAKMREEADILREALIGSVSHELRTPLSSITGTASVLAQSSDIAGDPKLAPLVQGLREESERLNSHIQNLLDASRISSEGIRPRNEWIDPGDVVNAAVERRQRLLANHTVSVNVAGDLPLVLLDPLLIERALGQLIDNAVKYSAPGTLIEIKAERSGDEVRVAVRDQGLGMTGSERERIWERFYRGPRSRDGTAGSGLGLWITRELVAACKGHVDAFSAGIGEGSIVVLYLPVQARSAAGPAGAADD